MSGVPRSQALLQWSSGAAGFGPIFTAPNGYVVLLKSFYSDNPGTVNGVASLYVRTADSTILVTLASLTVAANDRANWQGWIVLNPGDQILVNASEANLHFWVSGAVLAGPNQFPPA